jgi:hypothetical protein
MMSVSYRDEQILLDLVANSWMNRSGPVAE